MKFFNLFFSILLFSLFSSHVIAQNDQLKNAISHAEEAVKATSGKEISTHANAAKAAALEAKKMGDFSDDAKYHLEAGILNLERILEKGGTDAVDEAHKQANDAVRHFKEISVQKK